MMNMTEVMPSMVSYVAYISNGITLLYCILNLTITSASSHYIWMVIQTKNIMTYGKKTLNTKRLSLTQLSFLR